MYLNGMGLRGIERVTDIHHTAIMRWIREAGHQVSDAPESEEIPEITDLDELQANFRAGFSAPGDLQRLWLISATNFRLGRR